MIKNEAVRDAIYKFMKCESERWQVRCRKCGHKYGKKFIDYRKAVKSIDNRDAFQVFFMCNNDWHHFFKMGFTSPVDFNINNGEYDLPNQNADMPDDDAPEKDWDDWAAQQYERVMAKARA